LDTTIQVQKDADSSLRFQMSPAEAQSLKEIIEEKSDQKVDPHEIQGELVGIDIALPHTYFHIKATDGSDVQGKLAETFPRDKEWAVHVNYIAVVLQITTIRYATGEEKIDWVLASLRPPAPAIEGPK
jgi:hypothetical protein